jgi:NADH:ubiquinone oxidoreductase subunit C
MESLNIAEKIKEIFPEEVLDVREFRGQVSVTLRKNRVRDIARYLHDDPDLYFDYLVDVCGVDYLGKKEKRFEVVYHLYSIKHRHAIRLKAEVSGDAPRSIQSRLYGLARTGMNARYLISMASNSTAILTSGEYSCPRTGRDIR